MDIQNNQSGNPAPRNKAWRYAAIGCGTLVALFIVLLLFVALFFVGYKIGATKKNNDVAVQTYTPPTTTNSTQDKQPLTEKDGKTDNKLTAGGQQQSSETQQDWTVKDNLVFLQGYWRYSWPSGIYYNAQCNGRNFVVPNQFATPLSAGYVGDYGVVKYDENTARIWAKVSTAKKVMGAYFRNTEKWDLTEKFLGRCSVDDWVDTDRKLTQEGDIVYFDVPYSFVSYCPGSIHWCYRIVGPDYKFYPGSFKGTPYLPKFIDEYPIPSCDNEMIYKEGKDRPKGKVEHNAH